MSICQTLVQLLMHLPGIIFEMPLQSPSSLSTSMATICPLHSYDFLTEMDCLDTTIKVALSDHVHFFSPSNSPASLVPESRTLGPVHQHPISTKISDCPRGTPKDLLSHGDLQGKSRGERDAFLCRGEKVHSERRVRAREAHFWTEHT